MKCPECKLENPENASRCDCGYVFEINETKNSVPDTNNPLYGVKGWLSFIVVINLYIKPIFFGIGQIITWVAATALAEKYPGMIFTSLIDTGVGVYFVVWGIKVGKDLSDIKPRAVQNAKSLLKFGLLWTFVSIPISFLSGLDSEQLMVDNIKVTVGGIIGFAIWYSYFNVSKRVQATYPDWND